MRWRPGLRPDPLGDHDALPYTPSDFNDSRLWRSHTFPFVQLESSAIIDSKLPHNMTKSRHYNQFIYNYHHTV